VIDLPRPVHRDNAVVVGPESERLAPGRSASGLRRVAACKDAPDLLFQAHFRQDHFGKKPRPAAFRQSRQRSGGLLKSSYGQNYAQVLVKQQNARGMVSISIR